MSLDRLIKLAQKTGDRLIVHDEFSGQDVVILDVDSYERLFDLSAGARERWSTLREPLDKGIEDPWNAFDDDDDYYREDGDEWTSVDDVIGNRFGSSADPWAKPSYDPSVWSLDDDKVQSQAFPALGGTRQTGGDGAKSAEIKVEDIPSHVPLSSADDAAGVPAWREDPLPDEPVFYEEPV